MRTRPHAGRGELDEWGCRLMSERLGAEVLAEMLEGYGVTHLFMVPAILRRTLVEIERRTEIRRIQVHAEKSAAYMADGYARASGRPGPVHGSGGRRPQPRRRPA